MRRSITDLRTSLEKELSEVRSRIRTELVGKRFFPRYGYQIGLDLKAGGSSCPQFDNDRDACLKCDTFKADDFEKWFGAVMAMYNLAKSYQDEDLQRWTQPRPSSDDNTEAALHSELYALTVWQVWLVYSVHVAEVLGLDHIPTHLDGMDDQRGPGNFGGILTAAEVESDIDLFPTRVVMMHHACERELAFHQLVAAPKSDFERKVLEADKAYEEAYQKCRVEEDSQRDSFAVKFREARDRLSASRERLRLLVRNWYESLLASKMFIGSTGMARELDLNLMTVKPLKINWGLGYDRDWQKFQWPPISVSSQESSAGEWFGPRPECDSDYGLAVGFSDHRQNLPVVKYPELETEPYVFPVDLRAPPNPMQASPTRRTGTAIGANENEKPEE